MDLDIKKRLEGCLVAGAIGDAIGYRYENSNCVSEIDFDFDWQISDDTQLTIATCEAIAKEIEVKPEKVAERFLYWYQRQRLTGLGASTLKALRELAVGGHWALVGRSGEFAAGNGAAMRIAPLAFKKYMTKLTIKDICSITHKNDEAYCGALSVYYAIHFAIAGLWTTEDNLITFIIDKIPDTKVRDRLIELEKLSHLPITEVGKIYKPSGYVVDSVPMAIFAAQQINKCDYKTIITDLIYTGGDTDTTCSIFGQIAGTLKGVEMIPDDFIIKFNNLEIKNLIYPLIANWKE